MKRIIFIIPLLVVISCTAPGTRQVADPWLSDQPQVFIDGFTTAALSHDSMEIMYYFDDAYIQEQIGDDPGGRRDRFMRRIFNGNFPDIRIIQAQSVPRIIKSGKPQTVIFTVTFGKDDSKKMRLFMMRLNGGEKTFALSGKRE